jgi:DNA-binding LacI/PurR family transcriptional regulator
MTGQYSCVKGIKLIKPDNFSGMKKLMKYLMELGHRRIVFLQRIINDGINTTAESLNAIEEIKQDNPDLELEVFPVTDLTFDEGLRETLKRIDYIKKHKITAVAGSTDNVAAGILHALLDSGFKVPEEISVAGHDDYPLGAQVYPPLTTVRIDLKQMGRIAAAALIDFYMNRKKTGSVEFIPENLIVRKSTAKAFH